MRIKILVVALALAAAACGGGAADPEPSSTPSTTSPTTMIPVAEPARYAYGYTAGQSLAYAVSVEQHLIINATVEGDESFMNQVDGPLDGDVTTTVSGSITYDIADGPEPDTVQLTISGVFDTVDVDGTINGEPAGPDDMTNGAIPDLLQTPDTTIILDAEGRPVTINGEEVPADEGFLGDPFGAVGGLTSGGLDQPFGPRFPDRPLAVGDTWSQDASQFIPETEQTIESSITYTVTGVDTIDGVDVAVIEFEASNSEIVMDLGEMFNALFQGFAAMGEDGATAEIPQLDFTITVQPSSGHGTYWFDQDAGLVRKVSQTYMVPLAMHMGIDAPDGSGSTDMTMTVESTVEGQLQNPDVTTG